MEAAEFKDYDFEGHPNNLVKHDETIHNDKRQHDKMKQTYGKAVRRDRSHLQRIACPRVASIVAGP